MNLRAVITTIARTTAPLFSSAIYHTMPRVSSQLLHWKKFGFGNTISDWRWPSGPRVHRGDIVLTRDNRYAVVVANVGNKLSIGIVYCPKATELDELYGGVPVTLHISKVRALHASVTVSRSKLTLVRPCLSSFTSLNINLKWLHKHIPILTSAPSVDTTRSRSESESDSEPEAESVSRKRPRVSPTPPKPVDPDMTTLNVTVPHALAQEILTLIQRSRDSTIRE